jgi:hypothetical protein
MAMRFNGFISWVALTMELDSSPESLLQQNKQVHIAVGTVVAPPPAVYATVALSTRRANFVNHPHYVQRPL